MEEIERQESCFPARDSRNSPPCSRIPTAWSHPAGGLCRTATTHLTLSRAKAWTPDCGQGQKAANSERRGADGGDKTTAGRTDVGIMILVVNEARAGSRRPVSPEGGSNEPRAQVGATAGIARGSPDVPVSAPQKVQTGNERNWPGRSRGWGEERIRARACEYVARYRRLYEEQREV